MLLFSSTWAVNYSSATQQAEMKYLIFLSMRKLTLVHEKKKLNIWKFNWLEELVA